MVQVLRKPEERLLSPARWEFVDELWTHYEAAGRPTLELIAAKARQLNDSSEITDNGGTASTETLRKMLKGRTVPVSWQRVRAVLHALCDMAGSDPKADRWDDVYDGPSPSVEDWLRRLWSKGLDDPLRGQPRPQLRNTDPWGGSGGGWGGGSTIEPPF